MMPDKQIEGSDLSAIIASEIRSAQTFDQTKRALAIEYMRGEMSDLPPRPNGSSQTSRDVADTISWMLPGAVRVFTASDKMVEFQATQSGGEQGAEEASEYTNYSFFRENDGYRILYNATYDAMLMGNGAVCSYWCPEESKTKLFKDKSLEELALLVEEGWQGLGVEPQQTSMDNETGEPLYTVRLKLVTERGQIRDMTLKPENLLLNATATSIEEARFAAYLHDDLTRSDLMGMANEYGWDTGVIENLPAYAPRNHNEVTTARNARLNTNDDAPTKSGEYIDLYRCFVRVDRDGDGEAEILEVWYAGNAGQGAVLSSDEWDDDVPFTDIPCYPVPHAWQAESVYDRTADIQRVKTVLLRQAIDNTYAVMMPMREVEVGSVQNPDILVNPKFGGIVWRTKNSIGSAPTVPHVVPYIADKAFAALEYMDSVIAKRTGVSKTTMALDPETLQNQSATGTQLQHDAAYSQIELVARNMAELGWAKFFAKRRNLAKKYIKGGVPIPSRNGSMQAGQQEGEQNAYRTVQPEAWTDDMACTINVGLGTGSRDRDMSMLNLIMNGQVGMAERLANLPSPTAQKKAIEMVPKIRKTAVELAESSGLRNPDDYYPDMSEQDVQAIVSEMEQSSQQPDPKVQADMAKAQADQQLQQQKMQSDMQFSAAKLQADQQASQAKLEQDAQRMQMEFALKREQMAAELQLKREQLAAELQLKREEMMASLQVQREIGHANAQARAQATSSVHVGGEPG